MQENYERKTGEDKYKEVELAFRKFCRKNGCIPYKNCIMFEHGCFGCIAWKGDSDKNFIAVDLMCNRCLGKEPHCEKCGSFEGIGFEQV